MFPWAVDVVGFVTSLHVRYMYMLDVDVEGKRDASSDRDLRLPRLYIRLRRKSPEGCMESCHAMQGGGRQVSGGKKVDTVMLERCCHGRRRSGRSRRITFQDGHAGVAGEAAYMETCKMADWSGSSGWERNNVDVDQG
jgi:hypothetical protein